MKLASLDYSLQISICSKALCVKFTSLHLFSGYYSHISTLSDVRENVQVCIWAFYLKNPEQDTLTLLSSDLTQVESSRHDCKKCWLGWKESKPNKNKQTNLINSHNDYKYTKSNWVSSWENLIFVLCEQQSHKPACASTRIGQRLCYFLSEKLIGLISIF